MLGWLASRLGSPASTKEEPQLAGLLKPFLWVIIFFVILHGSITGLTAFNYYRSLLLAFHLPVLIGLGVTQYLTYRGRTYQAAWLCVSLLWLTFSIGILFVGGIQAPTFIGGYCLAVLIAGIFLGYRVSLFFAVLSILAALGMAILRSNGLLKGPGPNNPIFLYWLAQSIVLVATAELMRLATIKIGLSFDRSRHDQKYFRALIENSSDMVAVVNALGLVRYISPSVSRIFHYAPEDLEDHLAFDFIHPEDREVLVAEFAHLLVEPHGRQMAEFRIRRKDGQWRWVEAAGSNFLLDPDVQGVIINYRDVTERKIQEARHAHDAIHDPLTSLPNRVLFMDRLYSRVRRSQRDGGHHFAVLILDIDHFRNINDSLSHAAGDQILVEAARRLETCLRASDTIARLGGDEYGILLDETEGLPGAEQTVARIQDTLKRAFHLEHRELLLSSSLGVVLGPVDGAEPADYLRDAEIAMYRAKTQGRARHVLFDDCMRDGMLERIGLEAELRRALTNAEFRVYYQPVYSLLSGRLMGFEALARWQHPERGLLLPASFIDVAEETGLIVELDRWVMYEACRQLREWHMQMPDSRSLIINVNLSRRQLTRVDLVESVSRILADTGLDPDCLRPEITESLIMENVDFSMKTLQDLDGMGVRIEIDDFGNGYSSLTLLSKLPVRTLKIDRDIVKGIGPGSKTDMILRMIIALGHSLNMEVIAEGIESQAQLEQLRELGCEYGQGFLFSRCVDPDEARSLVTRQASQVVF